MSTEPDVIDVCGDGGLLKKIIKEGTGEATPKVGAEVSVHYVGTLLDGTKFDSSRDRNELFKFKLGQGSVIKGWDKGVATMKQGEVAILTCRADYAYGAEGSPPKIPGNATLQFEVELFSWESLTKVSDGVKKEILAEGVGYAKPNDRATVTTNLTGKRADGTIFENRDAFVWVIGDNAEVPLGLDEGVKSMKKGEKAEIHIEAAHGFEAVDEKTLPVGENLVYVVELLDFTKGKERWEMDTKEKIEFANGEKVKGNEFFKINRNERALKKYKAAMEFVQYETSVKEDDLRNEIEELKFSCQSNMAAVKLRQKEYGEVLSLTKKAMEIHPKNDKVLYRRAQAFVEIGSLEEATNIVKDVLSETPDNKPMLLLKARIEKLTKAVKEREKKVFGGIFNKWQKLVTPEEEEARAAEAKKLAERAEADDSDSDSDVDMADADKNGDVEMRDAPAVSVEGAEQ